MGVIYKNKIRYDAVTNSSEGGPVEIDYSLTQADMAGDSKTIGDRFTEAEETIEEFNKLAEYNHLKYDKANDKILVDIKEPGQTTSNWVEWMDSGYNSIVIFDWLLDHPFPYDPDFESNESGQWVFSNDGVQKLNNKDSFNSEYSGDVPMYTIGDNGLDLSIASAKWTTHSLATSQKINLAPYKTLHATFYCNNAVNEMELDISNINTYACIGLMFRVGSASSFIDLYASNSVSYIKESGGMSLTIISDIEETAIAHKVHQYTNINSAKRTCYLTKFWLE